MEKEIDTKIEEGSSIGTNSDLLTHGSAAGSDEIAIAADQVASLDTVAPEAAPETTDPAVAVIAPKMMRDERPARGRDNRKGGRRPSRRDPRMKPEFDQKIISLRRVTRVVAGGRRFAFSVAVVAGNRKGQVGVGTGKAGDTPLAIEKAYRDAKKNMVTINTTRGMSIPHEVEAKFSASVVRIMPARGKGIQAGSSVRTVLELAGLKEVGAKLFSRSKNHTNNAKAAIKALEKLKLTKIRPERDANQK